MFSGSGVVTSTANKPRVYDVSHRFPYLLSAIALNAANMGLLSWAAAGWCVYQNPMPNNLN